MNRTSLIAFALLLAAGLSGCGGASSVHSSKLDLGSARWEPQASHSGASLRGLCAVDDQVAWASGSGGTVLRTVDGGAVWEIRPIGPGGEGIDELDFRDVHAFDHDRAVVVSAGLPGRIYRTADGGASWSLVYENTAEGVFFDAMAFWDELHGIAFSDPIGGKLLIIVTDDGGLTWRAIDSSSLPGTLEGEAGFAGSGTCLAVVGSEGAPRRVWIGLGGATGSETARVFHSPDGGRSWRVEASALHSSASAGIFSLAFRSPRVGVMVGGDYLAPEQSDSNVALTKDGGRAWMPADAQRRPRGYRSVVCWLPRENAFIAGGPTGTDYSLDDGRTWQPLGDEGFHVIAASPDGAAIWAAGAEGRIARLTGDQ